MKPPFLCRFWGHRNVVRRIWEPLGDGLFTAGEAYLCRRCENFYRITEVIQAQKPVETWDEAAAPRPRLRLL